MGDAASRSPWLGRASDEPSAPLEGSRTVDLAIVGAGLTGLWTAILLKDADPGLDVAVLEQKVVGYGASGRSAGIASPALGRSLAGLVRRLGEDAAGLLHREMLTSLRALVDFADAEGIHASLTRPGILSASTGPEQDERVEHELRAAERLGLEGIRALDRRACLSLVQCESLRRGLFDEHGLLLDPAALTRGLKDAALRRGIAVHEQTPVDAVETMRGLRVEVRTPFGTVHADRVLLATNAYAHAVPVLRRFVFTGYLHAVLSERLSDAAWAAVGWEDRLAIEDRRAFPYWCRPTTDGRILWGGGEPVLAPHGPTPRRDRDARRRAELEAAFRACFPRLRELRFEKGWAGPVCGTADGLPVVRWLAGERTLCALVPERGVGAAHLVARLARDLLLAEPSALAASPLANRRALPLPPEPLRSVALHTVQRNLAYADAGRGANGWVAKLTRSYLA